MRGRTVSKTFGLSLDAQPAALTCAVSFFDDTAFKAPFFCNMMPA